MRWDKESDEKLKKLISDGCKHEAVAEALNTTSSSVRNRCVRLGLKIVTQKKFTCLNCGDSFMGYIIENPRFCDRSCAVTFNNRKRRHSEETINKIRGSVTGKRHSEHTKSKLKGENNGQWKDGRTLKRKKERICRYCKAARLTKEKSVICEKCRVDYYSAYRPSCEFDFDVSRLSERFDLSLVDKYGWYSPSNRKNNLCGVSKDHMFSVRDGFLNKVDPKIIKHPANCQLLLHGENNRKNYLSSITLEELIARISTWTN